MLPIPRLGGVAILGGIIAALIVLGRRYDFLGWIIPSLQMTTLLLIMWECL